MQRSSESIASLAAALAKAQIALINPEKSLVATIRAEHASGTERAFRYASLASGLDIVRKTLGQHELAVMQTSAIDHTAGIVNLTTVLAHASGEWIASDWPVCAISDSATPRRMGAALTYARRYALFTLVGIAGEDDLDAPDLQAPGNPAPEPEPRKRTGSGWLNGGSQPGRRHGARHSGEAKPALGGKESAQLSEQLLGEIADLGSGENAALWAHRSLAQKNRLSAADAQRVEEAFAAKLSALGGAADEHIPAQVLDSRARSVRPRQDNPAPSKKRGRSRRQIDKSSLAIPELRRLRDRDHVRHVAKQPCLICGRRPSDAHHLRFAQSRALGRKVSDEFTVPLCRGHHREVHRCGDEAGWWAKVGIEPTAAARALWLQTHPLRVDADTVPAAALDGAGRRGRTAGKPQLHDETKPIAAAPSR
jgi:ERF superfamily